MSTKKRKTRKHKDAMDPIDLTESLGYKTFRKSRKISWDRAQDELLRKLVIEQYLKMTGAAKYENEHIPVQKIKWVDIALHFEGRKASDCSRRWTTSVDPSLRKGNWTPEEDALLIQAYNEFGSSWKRVADRIEGRSAGQCSKRYNDALSPQAKERLKPWDTEQDVELVRKVKKNGTQWSVIAAELEGRSGLSCRNRWRSIVTRLARNRAPEEIKREVGHMNLAYLTKGVEEKTTEDESSTESATPVAEETPNVLEITTKKNDAETERLKQLLQKTLTPILERAKQHQQPTPHFPVSRLAHSRVEHTYTLSKQNGEEVTVFKGPPNTGEFAQSLVELVKANGLNITIHQEIYHHYVPANQQIIEPETRAERYDHFNFLRPLAEVPKLTSSPSPDTRAYDSGDMELIRSLNMKHGKSSVLSPPPLSLSSMSPPKVATPQYMGENEMWDKPAGGVAAQNANDPVSQHHPLHYNLPNTSYNQVDGMSFGGSYSRDVDRENEEDDEEMESYANNYGIFYSVFAKEDNGNASGNVKSAEYYNPLLKDEEEDDPNPSYNGDIWGDVPFNPS